MPAAAARPIRVAVIGWGNFFGHIHEQTLTDLIGEGLCELRAVCVRSAATRAEIAARLPVGYDTAEAAQVCTDPEIDVVLIGAPQAVQAGYAIDALAAGKYVYVEKPLFCDEADTGTAPARFAQQFADLGSVGVERLAVGLNKRFAPAYVELRRRCWEQWGGIRHLHFSVVDDAWRWGAKYPDGFLLWLDLCHWLDAARWLTGAEVARLSCLEPQPNDAQLTLSMSDGSVASILLSGNGSMDMVKEELRVLTAGRCSARVSDFVELEVFGGPQPEVLRYPANRQTGGDRRYCTRIDQGGLPEFRAIRRQVFDRFQATRAADPQGDAEVRKNIPNFMRPQGWNESLRELVAAAAERRPVAGAAGWRDALIGYRLLDVTRASIAASGQFVDATSVL